MTIQSYTIGDSSLVKSDVEFDGDPRGLVWLWEEPSPKHQYVMAIDPSVGRTGWVRESRTTDDYKTDNGCIQIIRCGLDGNPDIQVAEYAAPIDAEELGIVANVLGRLFAGKDEQGMALCIIEMYPGPGMLTFREMMQRGYTNHFVWKHLDSAISSPSGKFGFWASTREAVKYLWMRSTRHIQKNGFVPRSKWLVEEMRNCEIDPVKMWGKAVNGEHDDRVRAMMMALWAIHDWSMQIDLTQTKVIKNDVKEASWQASDCSANKLSDLWEDRFAEIMEMA